MIIVYVSDRGLELSGKSRGRNGEGIPVAAERAVVDTIRGVRCIAGVPRIDAACHTRRNRPLAGPSFRFGAPNTQGSVPLRFLECLASKPMSAKSSRVDWTCHPVSTRARRWIRLRRAPSTYRGACIAGLPGALATSMPGTCAWWLAALQTHTSGSHRGALNSSQPSASHAIGSSAGENSSGAGGVAW